MPSGDGPYDRQTQSDTAGIAASRCLQSIEGLECALDLVLRHAGTVVVDFDDGHVAVFVDPAPGTRSKFQSVIHQVGEQALERNGVTVDDDPIRLLDRGV